MIKRKRRFVIAWPPIIITRARSSPAPICETDTKGRPNLSRFRHLKPLPIAAEEVADWQRLPHGFSGFPRHSPPQFQPPHLPASTVRSVLKANSIRTEEQTSTPQSLMPPPYAIFCLKKK